MPRASSYFIIMANERIKDWIIGSCNRGRKSARRLEWLAAVNAWEDFSSITIGRRPDCEVTCFFKQMRERS
jgi:hypothetical protein